MLVFFQISLELLKFNYFYLVKTFFQAILSWLNHPENEQDGVEEEEDLEEPPKSEDDSYVDSKAEVVFTILNTFNKKDYEGELGG